MGLKMMMIPVRNLPLQHRVATAAWVC